MKGNDRSNAIDSANRSELTFLRAL